MDTCPNVLWPPDGCLHSHRYHQRVPETSHDFVCYIPHCTVFSSDWLEGGSIGAEWLNRGRGTVSHSFHLESIFDPDPPQPSGTCNHHPPSNQNKKHIDDYNYTNYNCNNNKHLEVIFFLLLLSQNMQYNLKFELNRFAAFFHIFPYCLIICGSTAADSDGGNSRERAGD